MASENLFTHTKSGAIANPDIFPLHFSKKKQSHNQINPLDRKDDDQLVCKTHEVPPNANNISTYR